MICKFFKKRTKKGQNYFYCDLQKKKVHYKECMVCKLKEYKVPKRKLLFENNLKKHNLTKATEIPLKVKKEVWERDEHKCIFCHIEVPIEYANSHYIKRSQLGLGIPKNIMTNCDKCHKDFEETIKRNEMKEKAKKYFQSKYENWNEKELVYKKWGN